MKALGNKVSKGTQRETFFANQVGAIASLLMPKQGDFMVDGKYLFEVGSSQKTFDQIANLPDSYLAVDDVEVGMEIGFLCGFWAAYTKPFLFQSRENFQRRRKFFLS